MFFREFFSNVTTVKLFVDTGTVAARSVTVVKDLKEGIITVQHAYIDKELMLLFREEWKILPIHWSIYIWIFSVISQNSDKRPCSKDSEHVRNMKI